MYVKMHRVTKLKYLGISSQENVHRYQGSGKYWEKHIAQHGYDVKTIVVFSSRDMAEIRRVGLMLSEKWDIVTSEDWANLVPESGDIVLSAVSRVQPEEEKVRRGNKLRKTWQERPELRVQQSEIGKKQTPKGTKFGINDPKFAESNKKARRKKNPIFIPHIWAEFVRMLQEQKTTLEISDKIYSMIHQVDPSFNKRLLWNNLRKCAMREGSVETCLAW